jgi:hypothetical protein
VPQRWLRAHGSCGSCNTKSLRSWARSAPSVLAEAQQAESGQQDSSGRETHVLVMQSAEVGQGNHLTCVKWLDVGGCVWDGGK